MLESWRVPIGYWRRVSGREVAATGRPPARWEALVNSVLVLNQNYEPLNVCNPRRAIVLLDRGKAEVLEHWPGCIRTPSRALPRPSVIRLVQLIKRPRPRVRLTRREVFLRDNFTCQYCGRRAPEVVLHADHVQPWIPGGPTSLENLRTACSGLQST